MPRRPSSSSKFRAPRSIRRKPRNTRRTVKIIGLILVVAVIAVGMQQIWREGSIQRLFSRPQEVKDHLQLSDRVDQALREALDDLGTSPIFVIQDQKDIEEGGNRWRFRRLTVRVTSQISLLHCNLAITRAVQEAGGQVLSVVQGRSGERLTMELGVEGLRSHLVELISDKNIPPTRGRLSIIIDDFGAIDNQVANSFIQLPIALTLAVIPGHKTSQQVARQAVAAGHQVLLHLPMQPKDGDLGEENGILVDLPEDEIRRRVRWALAEIPQAAGVNNHMGSLATENRKVMCAVLEEIKAAGKFFVDSRTSSQSVALDVAKELGFSCDRSDGFLDSEDDAAQIKRRLEALAEKALQNGSAIGIGHIRANTLQALRDMIPRLEKKGVQFAHVSRVLEARR